MPFPNKTKLLGPFQIERIGEWDEIKKLLSEGYECVLFKYSSNCPISKGTRRTFEKWIGKIPETSKIIIGIINVAEAKTLVEAIADDLILTHQSPQVIWIDEDLDVFWHASHYDITVTALKKYLQKYLDKKNVN